MRQNRRDVDTVVAQRSIRLPQLTRELVRELDWVVMSAIATDREERYDSVSDLATDIERYLNNEPLAARPPSRHYQLRKCISKNRGPLITASLLMLALIAGIIGTSVGFMRAQERARGEQQAKEIAEKRLEQVKRSNDILTGIFADLNPRSIRANHESVESVVANRLVAAGQQLNEDSVGDPLILAELQDELGMSLVNLGFAPDAIPLFEKSLQTYRERLEENHPSTLNSLRHLAGAFASADENGKSLRLFEELYQICLVQHGLEHRQTVTAINGLANAYHNTGQLKDSLELYEQAFELKKKIFGPDHPSTLDTMCALAGNHLSLDDYRSAKPLFEAAFLLTKAKQGERSFDTLTRMNGLAYAYRQAGELRRSHGLFADTFRLRKSELGVEHPGTLRSLCSLADSFHVIGDSESAIQLLEESLPMIEAKLGENHTDTLLTKQCLANCYFSAGHPEIAIAKMRETLSLQEVRFSREHPRTQASLAYLGCFYRANGQLKDAIPLLRESVETSGRNPKLVWTVPELLRAYFQAGMIQEFDSLWEHQLASARSRFAADSPRLSDFLAMLAPESLHAGRNHDAELLLREALEILEVTNPGDWDTFKVHLLLTDALLAQEKFSQVDALEPVVFAEAKRLESNLSFVKWSDQEKILTRIAERFEELDRPEQARTWRALIRNEKGDAAQ